MFCQTGSRVARQLDSQAVYLAVGNVMGVVG